VLFGKKSLIPCSSLYWPCFACEPGKIVTRLLAALLGTGFLVALWALLNTFVFRHQLVLEDGMRRVHAMYGSANGIGLLFDYVFPIGIALVLARTRKCSRLCSNRGAAYSCNCCLRTSIGGTLLELFTRCLGGYWRCGTRLFWQWLRPIVKFCLWLPGVHRGSRRSRLSPFVNPSIRSSLPTT